MAKKYLLYIHDDRFNDEQEKSKLMNQLLENHYEAEFYRNMPTPKNTVTISKRYDAFVDTSPYEICKHGSTKRFCKKGCK